MCKQILVICTCNICRSPYGEYKLRSLLPSFTITSAGLDTDMNRLAGKPADSVAIKIAAESQINLRTHRAKQLTEEMIEYHDVVLGMDRKHMELLSEYFPSYKEKIYMFSDSIDGLPIEDPYRKGELYFRLTFNRIDDAAEAWAKKWGI